MQFVWRSSSEKNAAIVSVVSELPVEGDIMILNTDEEKVVQGWEVICVKVQWGQQEVSEGGHETHG